MADLKTRAQADKAYQWRLEDLFPTNEAWEEEFEQAKTQVAELADFSGKLTQSAQMLSDAIAKMQDASWKIERLFTYARMRRDEDNANALYQAMADRAMALAVSAQEATAFVQPQLLAAPDGLVEGWAREYKPLEPYRFMLEKMLRMKPHTLSEPEERLLAMAGEVLEAPHTIYSMLNDADMKFPTIQGEDGQDVTITHGRYIPLMESRNREVRKNAYEGMYSTYKGFINTISAAYSANVKAELFGAAARGFESTMAAALYENDIPLSVYHSLIEAMHDGVKDLSRYLQIRKKHLGVEKLRYYDLYVPLFEYEADFSYEQAQKNIAQGLRPLGDTYGADSARAYTDGWVDVYENQGKTSGAYSWGCYGTHPYILLNYQGTLDSMFTLAHELGHAMHSFYSDRNNSYENAQYPIFLAEVASTTNEMLLTRYRIDHAASKAEKQYLLNYLLEQFRTTMFRQTMFAEFEMKAHRAAQEGQPLTGEFLSGLYRELNLTYYPDVEMDEYIPYEWLRIPHFYRSFYVYQYATGFAAAVRFSEDLYEGKPGAQQRYLEKFLSAGGRKFPIEILKDAGVDMTSPDTVRQALAFFRETVDELEKTL